MNIAISIVGLLLATFVAYIFILNDINEEDRKNGLDI